MPPTKLPGKRKTENQPENECIHFLAGSRFFAVRMRTAGPALLACPEAEDVAPVSACVCRFYGVKEGFLLLF